MQRILDLARLCVFYLYKDEQKKAREILRKIVFTITFYVACIDLFV